MINAIYFDGKSAKAHPVKIAIQNNAIVIYRENVEGGPIRHPLINAHVDEGFQGAARRIDLGAGALLEIKDKAALQLALDKVGQKLGVVQKAQNSWAWAGGSLAALIGIIVLSYFVLIPFGAKHIATWLPESVDRIIGDQTWPLIESQMFKPSTLSAERQSSIRAQFKAATSQLTKPPSYQLEFRASKVGPNAIAVPGGRLVLTDELVALAKDPKDDNGIIGVLLHELGHIERRHSMRNIIQATAVTAIVSLWLGDVSSVVAAVPTMMATMKYSRDLETEADDFAIVALKQLRIPGQAVADLFAALEKAQGDKGNGESDEKRNESILSSHPVTAERIKKFSEIK
jgi:Zn-dependent protease with chaperone function